MSAPLLVTFVGVVEGQWELTGSTTVTGSPLQAAFNVAVFETRRRHPRAHGPE